MAIGRGIKEPPLPLDEHRFKGCLTWADGTLTYYINRRCKANLLWLFLVQLRGVTLLRRPIPGERLLPGPNDPPELGRVQ